MFLTYYKKKVVCLGFSQMLILNRQTLPFATEPQYMCVCVPVWVSSRGDFNLSVVMSLLWSSLYGVAICSVVWSNTTQHFLFLSLRLLSSLCLQTLLSIRLFSSLLLFVYFALSLLFLFFSPRLVFPPHLSLLIFERGRKTQTKRRTQDIERNTLTCTDCSSLGRKTGKQTDRQGPNYPCCVEHEISK